MVSIHVAYASRCTVYIIITPHSQASVQLPSFVSKEEKATHVLTQEELMDKAHTLEHVYNKECFMKVSALIFLSAEN